MKKTVLITGANGFLGSHLSRKLSSQYNVIGLVNDTLNLSRIQDLDISVVKSTWKNLDNIFKENEVFSIIHTATVYRIDDSVSNMINTNILLPIRLYELANKFQVNSFLNTDTFFNNKKAKNEYNYLSHYTRSKAHVIDWLRGLKGECKLINMKLFHMYGPNDSLSKFSMSICSKIINNTSRVALTSGIQRRDFVYVDDVVTAYLKVLDSNEIGKDYCEFEVGSGKSESIKSFVEKIKDISKSTSVLDFGALKIRNNEIMDAVADNKSLVDLGWNPNVSISEGIRMIIEDIRSRPV